MLPDKIYLAESDKVKGEISSNFASSIPFKMHTSICYIRKDALLEWLEERSKHLLSGGLTGYYESIGYEDLIDKINSL